MSQMSIEDEVLLENEEELNELEYLEMRKSQFLSLLG